HVLGSKRHWGVGVGRDSSSGRPAVVFLTREKTGHPGDLKTPRPTDDLRSAPFPVREMALDSRAFGLRYAPAPLIRSTMAGGFTGSAVSNDPNVADGGTLSGTFRGLSGGSQRAVTCAHVALGFGIEQLL